MPRAILFVEDDTALRATLAEHLMQDGEFVTQEAGTAADAEAMLSAGQPRYDAILLDVGLPDADGRDFCAKLRRSGHRLPVIMLTGADAEQDVIRGLDSGANDYIAKPFRPEIVVARLRAQLRAFDSSDDATFRIGPYTFRPSARQLVDAARNRKVRLTDKEASILKFLYRAGSRTVSRKVLLDEVWGYSSQVHTHTLETHVYRLRQKIEVDPAEPRLLVMQRGGYALRAVQGDA
ncbi:response regulator transcription factor [Paeniroseomonas aquatica]|uniref:Response regulator transcription factor n=1 Tax=Paeniroseomonas aquatica TaxID=373043 RepID=A0ABT8ADE0_9PROT|nr:response regulator transcription factor [Paeniroseomonas aquatica]MDN3567481.1 response regulator transcription factor [Paeniroseomonas aquatica]